METPCRRHSCLLNLKRRVHFSSPPTTHLSKAKRDAGAWHRWLLSQTGNWWPQWLLDLQDLLTFRSHTLFYATRCCTKRRVHFSSPPTTQTFYRALFFHKKGGAPCPSKKAKRDAASSMLFPGHGAFSISNICAQNLADSSEGHPQTVVHKRASFPTQLLLDTLWLFPDWWLVIATGIKALWISCHSSSFPQDVWHSFSSCWLLHFSVFSIAFSSCVTRANVELAISHNVDIASDQASSTYCNVTFEECRAIHCMAVSGIPCLARSFTPDLLAKCPVTHHLRDEDSELLCVWDHLLLVKRTTLRRPCDLFAKLFDCQTSLCLIPSFLQCKVSWPLAGLFALLSGCRGPISKLCVPGTGPGVGGAFFSWIVAVLLFHTKASLAAFTAGGISSARNPSYVKGTTAVPPDLWTFGPGLPVIKQTISWRFKPIYSKSRRKQTLLSSSKLLLFPLCATLNKQHQFEGWSATYTFLAQPLLMSLFWRRLGGTAHNPPH